MSATLIVVAPIIAKAGHADAVKAAFLPLVEASRKEAGCLRYEFHVDNNNPHRFVMVEEWTDKAALEFHMTTPHFQSLGKQLAGLIDVEIIELSKLV